MTGKFKTNVTSKDIEIDSSGAVHIHSKGLLNTFIHSPPHALEKLAKDVTYVSIDSISVDDHGRIVIEDDNFRNALKLKFDKTVEEATNYVCNNGYQCKEK